MENMEDAKNQKNAETHVSALSKSVLALAGAALLVALFIFGWYILSPKPDVGEPDKLTEVVSSDITQSQFKGTFQYTIPGVPYVGVHNHVGEIGYVRGDTDGVLASLLSYWSSGEIDIADTVKEIAKNNTTYITFKSVEDHVLGLGDYVVKREHLDLVDIKKYVNPELKTPLFLFLPLDVAQPLEVGYHPANVLIGINEPEQKLIVHSYWLGNNYEISFGSFEALQKKLPKYDQNTYFVIQPINLGKALEKIKTFEGIAYPARGVVMNESMEMFKNYAMGSGAKFGGLFAVAERYLKQVVNDPKFEKFMPPYFKVMALYQLGESELALGNDAEAKEHVMKAIELNHDLDKSFVDWPGYKIHFNTPNTITDRIAPPHRVLGDIHMRLNEPELARSAYKNALAIDAVNSRALRGLRLSEIRLSPEIRMNIGNDGLADLLANKSPWDASWKHADGRSGTFKMSFSYSKERVLSGRFFNSSIGVADGPIRDVSIQNGCASFIFSVSNNHYDLCLTKTGILKGVISSFPVGGSFIADIIVRSTND